MENIEGKGDMFDKTNNSRFFNSMQTKNLGLSKLKASADDKLNVNQIMISAFDSIETLMEKE